MNVCVVVLNWNQHALTASCVRSLLALDYSDYRIVVVDNGSQDGSAEKLRAEFGDRVHIIVNPTNLGFAAGNNVGIRYALANGAQFIMLLNNDTVVSPGLLEPLISVLKSRQGVAAVTPKILYYHAPNRIWAAGGRIRWLRGDARSRGQGEVDHGQYDQPQIVDYATGCCLLIPRWAFERVGLLDEGYFAYYEDTDWCMRARKIGLEIRYEPRASIRHVAGASTKHAARSQHSETTTPFVYYLTARNHLHFIHQHCAGFRFISALAFYFIRRVLFYLIAFAILGRWEKLLAVIRGVRDGFVWTFHGNPGVPSSRSTV